MLEREAGEEKVVGVVERNSGVQSFGEKIKLREVDSEEVGTPGQYGGHHQHPLRAAVKLQLLQPRIIDILLRSSVSLLTIVKVKIATKNISIHFTFKRRCIAFKSLNYQLGITLPLRYYNGWLLKFYSPVLHHISSCDSVTA